MKFWAASIAFGVAIPGALALRGVVLRRPSGACRPPGFGHSLDAWSNFSLRVTKPFEPRKQMLRICSSHSRSTNKKTALRRLFLFVERETGFEPATLSLEGDSSPFS